LGGGGGGVGWFFFSPPTLFLFGVFCFGVPPPHFLLFSFQICFFVRQKPKYKNCGWSGTVFFSDFFNEMAIFLCLFFSSFGWHNIFFPLFPCVLCFPNFIFPGGGPVSFTRFFYTLGCRTPYNFSPFFFGSNHKNFKFPCVSGSFLFLERNEKQPLGGGSPLMFFFNRVGGRNPCEILLLGAPPPHPPPPPGW